MRLFNDRYLVRAIPPSQKTAGGIVLPDSAKPKYNRSEVVLVGEGYAATGSIPARPLKAKAGDIVMHHSKGVEHDYNGETLLLVTEGELIGIE